MKRARPWPNGSRTESGTKHGPQRKVRCIRLGNKGANGYQHDLNHPNAKVRAAGFEPATCGLEVHCSIRLSYARKAFDYIGLTLLGALPSVPVASKVASLSSNKGWLAALSRSASPA